MNALVSDAMKDIQEEIDLQTLVNDAMAEFQGIHQDMVKAEQQRQQEKERQRLAEQKRQKSDKGWSFSR